MADELKFYDVPQSGGGTARIKLTAEQADRLGATESKADEPTESKARTAKNKSGA